VSVLAALPVTAVGVVCGVGALALIGLVVDVVRSTRRYGRTVQTPQHRAVLQRELERTGRGER
jgi:hypothetical protein